MRVVPLLEVQDSFAAVSEIEVIVSKLKGSFLHNMEIKLWC